LKGEVPQAFAFLAIARAGMEQNRSQKKSD
jgi:hypothetical protein